MQGGPYNCRNLAVFDLSPVLTPFRCMCYLVYMEKCSQDCSVIFYVKVNILKVEIGIGYWLIFEIVLITQSTHGCKKEE